MPQCSHCLGADTSIQSNRLRAVVHLLILGSAVAILVSCLAVELVAALAGAQDVVLVGKWVAKFAGTGVSISLMSFIHNSNSMTYVLNSSTGREKVSQCYCQSEKGRGGVLTVNIIGIGRVTKEEWLGEGLGGGNLDRLYE